MFAVIQGFGPFGGLDDNPSELLVRALAERAVPDIHTEVLRVSARQAAAAVPELMGRFRPRLYLGVGLAAGRTALAVEAVAVNLADWPQAADDDGTLMTREPVSPGGPAAHLTSLPVTSILGAWQAAGIPGYLSQTAGSYLCNYSFYAAAQAAAELGVPCMVGFLHVPLLPEQVTDPERQPSMSMALQAAGLDAVIAACRTADSVGPYLET
jgi:pyroglutamyl-peptidase